MKILKITENGWYTIPEQYMRCHYMTLQLECGVPSVW